MRDGRTATYAAMVAVSLALHAAGFAFASRLERRDAPGRVPAVVEFEAVPPPPRALRAEPPPEPSRARRVAVAKLPPPVEPPSPPPPHAASTEVAEKRAVPRVGVSLSSTTRGGAFAVGVGNTLYGRAPEVAPDPASVKAYDASGSAPPTHVAARPRLIERPEIAYPPEARRAGVEGQVVLLLRLDAEGRVVAARVLAEPGAGLGAAARAAALGFRFSPALLDGEAVETEIRFTYSFVLE